jgi:hypothetical protein
VQTRTLASSREAYTKAATLRRRSDDPGTPADHIGTQYPTLHMRATPVHDSPVGHPGAAAVASQAWRQLATPAERMQSAPRVQVPSAPPQVSPRARVPAGRHPVYASPVSGCVTRVQPSVAAAQSCAYTSQRAGKGRQTCTQASPTVPVQARVAPQSPTEPRAHMR